MYCPNCGQSNTFEQRFCRNCGLNLETVAETLSLQLNEGHIAPVDRRLELFGKVVFGGLGIIGLAAVAGMIYTVITGFILSGKGVAFGIIVSLLILFGALAVAWVVLNEGRKGKNTPRARNRPEPELKDAETAKLLHTGKTEPIPSIIDDTTDLLPVDAVARKR